MFILRRLFYRFHISKQKIFRQTVLENKEYLCFSLLSVALYSKSKHFTISYNLEHYSTLNKDFEIQDENFQINQAFLCYHLT